MTKQECRDKHLNTQMVDKVMYMTSKLLLFWRLDKDRAYNWFMSKEPLVRLILVITLSEIATDEDTAEGLKADCREIAVYFNAHYPTK